MKKKNAEKTFAILMSVIAMILGCFLIYVVDTNWEAVMTYTTIWLGIGSVVAGVVFFIAYVTGFMGD